MAAAALRLTFPNGTPHPRPPFGELTGPQQRAMRTLASLGPGTWHWASRATRSASTCTRAAGGPVIYTLPGQQGFGQPLQATGWLRSTPQLTATLTRPPRQSPATRQPRPG